MATWATSEHQHGSSKAVIWQQHGMAATPDDGGEEASPRLRGGAPLRARRRPAAELHAAWGGRRRRHRLGRRRRQGAPGGRRRGHRHRHWHLCGRRLARTLRWESLRAHNLSRCLPTGLNQRQRHFPPCPTCDPHACAPIARPLVHHPGPLDARGPPSATNQCADEDGAGVERNRRDNEGAKHS